MPTPPWTPATVYQNAIHDDDMPANGSMTDWGTYIFGNSVYIVSHSPYTGLLFQPDTSKQINFWKSTWLHDNQYGPFTKILPSVNTVEIRVDPHESAAPYNIASWFDALNGKIIVTWTEDGTADGHVTTILARPSPLGNLSSMRQSLKMVVFDCTTDTVGSVIKTDPTTAGEYAEVAVYGQNPGDYGPGDFHFPIRDQDDLLLYPTFKVWDVVSTTAGSGSIYAAYGLIRDRIWQEYIGVAALLDPLDNTQIKAVMSLWPYIALSSPITNPHAAGPWYLPNWRVKAAIGTVAAPFATVFHLDDTIDLESEMVVGISADNDSQQFVVVTAKVSNVMNVLSNEAAKYFSFPKTDYLTLTYRIRFYSSTGTLLHTNDIPIATHYFNISSYTPWIPQAAPQADWATIDLQQKYLFEDSFGDVGVPVPTTQYPDSVGSPCFVDDPGGRAVLLPVKGEFGQLYVFGVNMSTYASATETVAGHSVFLTWTMERRCVDMIARVIDGQTLIFYVQQVNDPGNAPDDRNRTIMTSVLRSAPDTYSDFPGIVYDGAWIGGTIGATVEAHGFYCGVFHSQFLTPAFWIVNIPSGTIITTIPNTAYWIVGWAAG